MLKQKIRSWLIAIRPFSFTGSVIPVTLGALLGLNQNRFEIMYLILSLLGIILLQAAVNLLSDHDDFENNVDTVNSFGSSGVIIKNLLSSKSVQTGGYLCLIFGCLIGLFLTYQRGIMILLFGLIGAFGGYSYTRKPLRLKYRGLGAPLVFLLFGPLMVIGSYYVQVQSISIVAFYIAIPVGLLTTAILHANDIRDIEDDKKAGIKTLSIMVGLNQSKNLYYGMIFLSYFAITLMILLQIVPYWSFLCILTFPEAYKNIKTLFYNEEMNTDLINLDKSTAKLQAQFGILLIGSFLIDIFI